MSTMYRSVECRQDIRCNLNHILLLEMKLNYSDVLLHILTDSLDGKT